MLISRYQSTLGQRRLGSASLRSVLPRPTCRSKAPFYRRHSKVSVGRRRRCGNEHRVTSMQMHPELRDTRTAYPRFSGTRLTLGSLCPGRMTRRCACGTPTRCKRPRALILRKRFIRCTCLQLPVTPLLHVCFIPFFIVPHTLTSVQAVQRITDCDSATSRAEPSATRSMVDFYFFCSCCNVHWL